MQGRITDQRLRLCGAILGMLKGQIEKTPLSNAEFAIDTRCDTVTGEGLRAQIAGKGAWRGPVNIARELIADQDQGQGARRCQLPEFEFAAFSGRHQRAETAADLSIECRLALIPHGAARVHCRSVVARAREPELEHRLWSVCVLVQSEMHQRMYAAIAQRGATV